MSASALSIASSPHKSILLSSTRSAYATCTYEIRTGRAELHGAQSEGRMTICEQAACGCIGSGVIKHRGSARNNDILDSQDKAVRGYVMQLIWRLQLQLATLDTRAAGFPPGHACGFACLLAWLPLQHKFLLVMHP